MGSWWWTPGLTWNAPLPVAAQPQPATELATHAGADFAFQSYAFQRFMSSSALSHSHAHPHPESLAQRWVWSSFYGQWPGRFTAQIEWVYHAFMDIMSRTSSTVCVCVCVWKCERDKLCRELQPCFLENMQVVNDFKGISTSEGQQMLEILEIKSEMPDWDWVRTCPEERYYW